MLLNLVLAGAMLLPIAGAPAIPDAATLETGLAGRWSGALGYRDYQSNMMFELPVASEIRALPDGVSILRISTFDDGPKTGAVIITTASLHDPKAGTVTSATLRKGRAVEVATDSVTVTAYADATHWTVEALQDGSDDDKPALLRVTEVRNGDTLTATKDVQPKGGKAGWQFRNVLRLTRLP